MLESVLQLRQVEYTTRFVARTIRCTNFRFLGIIVILETF
jgi:hypothetical protein